LNDDKVSLEDTKEVEEFVATVVGFWFDTAVISRIPPKVPTEKIRIPIITSII
jgi:hypothetical protein